MPYLLNKNVIFRKRTTDNFRLVQIGNGTFQLPPNGLKLVRTELPFPQYFRKKYKSLIERIADQNIIVLDVSS